MRLFFLILLLANLALWYWHQPVVAWLHASAPERASRPSAIDAPPLVLLAEREAAAARSEATPERKPAPSSAPAAEPDAAATSPGGTDAAQTQARTPARTQVEMPTQAQVQPPAQPRSESAPASGSRSESRSGSESRPQPAPAVTASARAADAAGNCVEIGPWSDAAAAEAARAGTLGEGVQAELVTVERLRPAGFWMLTADRYDRSGARQTLQRMQEQGVEDIAIVSLDSGWAISLGLYSRSSALERRRAQMLQLGYTPEVRERSETRTEYLLRLSPGSAAVTAAQEIAAATSGLEWRTTDCLVAPD